MKNKALKEQWEFYQCANQMAHLGILMDFIKQSANQFYESKSKKEKIEEDDIAIFMHRFDEIKTMIDSLLQDVQ